MRRPALLLALCALAGLVSVAPAPAAPVYGTLAPIQCLQDTENTADDGCAKVPGLRNAAFVAISPDGRHAYVNGRDDNALVAFARNRQTGELTRLEGTGACFQRDETTPGCAVVPGLYVPSGLAVAPDGRSVYVVGKGSNAITAFARDVRTGKLTALGCSGGPEREEGCAEAPALSRPNAVAVSPDGRFVYVSSSGTSGIVAFARDPGTGAISFASCLGVNAVAPCTALAGGRDLDWLAMAPDGNHLYAVASGSNSVVALARDAASGGLTPLGCWSGGSDGTGRDVNCNPATGLLDAGQVVVSPDGRFVYASSDDGNDVAIFQRDPGSGLLVQPPGPDGCVGDFGEGFETCSYALGLTTTYGLAIDPAGSNIYVGSYGSGSLASFRRNPDTGLFTRLEPCFSASDPLCTKRASMERAGHVVVSPDGRHVYLAAPDGDAIHVFGRTADPPVLKLLNKGFVVRKGRSRLQLRCPADAVLGCFGQVQVRVLGASGAPAGNGVTRPFDLPAGKKVVLKPKLDKASLAAFAGTARDVVQVDITSREPSGREISYPGWLSATVRGR